MSAPLFVAFIQVSLRTASLPLLEISSSTLYHEKFRRFNLMLKLVNFLAAGAFGGFLTSQTQPRTLVLLDNWAITETHAYLWHHLSETLDHEVRFSMISESNLNFKELDNWRVDNVILMAPSVKGNTLSSWHC